ncbi:autophagy protein Apg6-domain-containing protein [Gautieria morchelliformis]|nr:autophagy protein Apg6-domain-containing protein [Gautieria morchelliformis]
MVIDDSTVHNIPSPPDIPLSSQRRLSFTSRNRITLNPGTPTKHSSSSDLRQPPTPTPAPPSPSPLKQLEETKKERDRYIAFEKDIRKEKERERNASSLDAIERKILRLKEDERTAVEELKTAESELERLNGNIQALERDESELREEAESVFLYIFWWMHNANSLLSAEQTAQLRSLRVAYAADSQTLEKLERTNVYYDTFCIGNIGVFGTINGLCLGRAGGVAVEWSEINAARGQCTLLLYTLARKLDVTFEKYCNLSLASGVSNLDKTNTTSDSERARASAKVNVRFIKWESGLRDPMNVSGSMEETRGRHAERSTVFFDCRRKP